MSVPKLASIPAILNEIGVSILKPKFDPVENPCIVIGIVAPTIVETPKPIAMNVVDKTDVIVEEPILIEQPAPVVEPEKEAAPPVELNVSKGDW